jgi:tol-pal system protein YbgF
MKRQLDYLEKSSTQTQERLILLDSLYRSALDRNITYQADLQVTLKELLDRTNIIDGRLTDIENRIEAIMSRMDVTYTRPTRPVAEQSDSTGDTVATSSGLPRVDPVKMFDNAFADLKAGNFDLAIIQFEEFLNQFDDTDLADDAQYWLGECHYGKKDYTRALSEFERVERKYPESDKMVSALFKAARCQQELGNVPQARALFQRIVDEFSESFEADAAARRLQEL